MFATDTACSIVNIVPTRNAFVQSADDVACCRNTSSTRLSNMFQDNLLIRLESDSQAAPSPMYMACFSGLTSRLCKAECRSPLLTPGMSVE